MAGRSPDSVTRSLSACALRSQDARRPSSKTLKDFPFALSSTLTEQRGPSPQGASNFSNSAPLFGRRRTSAPSSGRPRTGPGGQRRPMTSSMPLAGKDGHLSFPTLASTFSAALPSKPKTCVLQRTLYRDKLVTCTVLLVMSLSLVAAFRYAGVRLRLLRGNIVHWQGDCIVNAANVHLEPSRQPEYWRHIGRRDVNSAVHDRAGPSLAKECLSLPLVESEASSEDWVASAPGHGGKVRCPRGEARLTGGHLLQCKHLIHAVGPDYDTAVRCAGSAKATAEAHEKAKQLLADTYKNAFTLANKASARSVALPAISCGVNGFGGYDSLDCAAKVSIQAALENVGNVQSIDFILYDAICSEAWEEAADANEGVMETKLEWMSSSLAGMAVIRTMRPLHEGEPGRAMHAYDSRELEAQQLLRQRKKMAKQEVNEVMKFDDAFDMAKVRAVQRTAAERKMLSQLPIQVGNSGSPMCVRELLGLRKISSTSLFSRRKSNDSLWGSMVLSKIPGSKEEAESEKVLEGRRKSSIKQSFNSFGDVVVAAQAAARKDLLDSSPRSAKGGESRRNSLRRGSIAEETVARLLRRSAFNNADLKDQFELKEILDPPAPAEMYTRFKVEDISSFPASEQERIREAFYRFKSIGSSDIDVDDLEKALIHLGYLKIDAQAEFRQTRDIHEPLQ
ncbi:O-acetyl-ADP-ribose deacetylase MACROD2 [Symbiodinium microadriaticum]|uniref:O-acetyl-ADP-ribose deacetylase MACROD2 n=1 Tax=Symbiodinium microadriaticum TaxID=2951 RepID=A0A1Q9D674_SYMMI|nr:O-acetyl-ADP-ribose deacetylase MACROD2 [Symbiodinium microadriaticum]